MIDEEKLALEIINKGPDVIDSNAEELKAKRVGAYWTFTDEKADENKEYTQIESIKELISNYLGFDHPEQPLCLAVFGQPGSGKSFAVKEIQKEIGKDKFGVSTINLTQLQHEGELSASLKYALYKKCKKNKIPFIFFDEFDTSKNGSPWGWLSWFLMPMNDAAYLLNGEEQKIKKAVFIFAGGTAYQFTGFSENNSIAFKKAKGPDFISRLHGYLDISGPNDRTRTKIRRAVILNSVLKKRALVRNRPEKEGVEINTLLAKALLGVSRYRHGARSIIATILSAKTITDTSGSIAELKFDDLPDDHILAIHSDRGPLDPERIGGGIQFSGGATLADQNGMEPIWLDLAGQLWMSGASLVYGGAWNPGKDNLSTLLDRKAQALSTPLYREVKEDYEIDEKPEIIRFYAYPPTLFDTEPGVKKRINKFVQKEKTDGITERDRDAITGVTTELNMSADTNLIARLHKAVDLFRMRLQIARASAATVVIGGKIKEYSGRYPGIAEEVALALALGHPVYLCGSTGGLVKELGGVLGIIPYEGPPAALTWPINDAHWDNFKLALPSLEYVFQPPGHSDFPLSDRDLIDFFKSHAMGSPEWPDNGLTPEENRRLFREPDISKATELIIRGIYRRFRIAS